MVKCARRAPSQLPSLPAGCVPSCCLPHCPWIAAPPAVDSVLGSRHPEPAAATQAAQQLVQEQAPCADQAKAFADCMAWSEGDMGACQVGAGGWLLSSIPCVAMAAAACSLSIVVCSLLHAE